MRGQVRRRGCEYKGTRREVLRQARVHVACSSANSFHNASTASPNPPRPPTSRPIPPNPIP
jgi:hypothetical protein